MSKASQRTNELPDVSFTVQKAKVGPLLERYLDGEYQSVERMNEEGVKRRAVLGLDNSHSKDYRVAYASDPLIVIKGMQNASHENLRKVLDHVGVTDSVNLSPIEIPHSQGWKDGFKSTPDRVSMIDHGNLYNRFERRVEREQDILGDKTGFTVYFW